MLAPFLLFVLTTIAYLSNGRTLGTTDTIPARYLPFSIIRELDFDLDEFPFLYAGGWIPHFLRYQNGHYISNYPPGSALLATPVYLLPVLAGLSPESPLVPHLEKVAAALIAAGSAGFVLAALRRVTTQRRAGFVAIVYAFGTSTFSVSSQALWQHGPSQFFLALGLYLLTRGLEDERFIPWSGFVFGAAVIMRYTDALLVLPVVVYVLRYHRAQFPGWILCGLPPVVFQSWYNHAHFGAVFDTGYGVAALNAGSAQWSSPFWDGLLGILISPHSGLFVFSPVLLLSVAGMLLVWLRGGNPLFKFVSLGPILVILLYSKWHFWWVHWYGARLLADVTPLLVLYLYPVCDMVADKRPLRVVLYTLALVSVAIHGIGAFAFEGMSSTWWAAGKQARMEHDRIWSWRESPPLYYGRRLFAEQLSLLRSGLSAFPTAPEAPQALSASFELQAVPDSLSAAKALALTLAVTNTGRAIWPFRTTDGRGVVKAGWRWFRDGRPVPYGEGRVPLSRNVLPGDQERLALTIWPPSLRGRYALEVGMVSEQVTWFAQRRIPLEVTGRCDFDTVIGEGLDPLPDPPSIGVAADRPYYLADQVAVVSLQLRNGPITRNLSQYVFLRRPDGTLRLNFSAAELGPNPPCDSWIPRDMFAILPRYFRIDPLSIGLRLGAGPPGPYTLTFLVTKPNTTKVVAIATSTFFLLQPPAEHSGR